MSHELDPRRLAARVIVKVLVEHAFAAAALSAELDRLPQMSGRDRGLATELTYGTLRAARYLEGELSALAPRGLGGLDPATRAPLWIAAYQVACLTRVPAHAAVGAAVEEIKAHNGAKVAGFANAILRKFAANARDPRPVPLELAMHKGTPRWLGRALERALGPELGPGFLGAGPVPPPLCLRIRDGQRDRWAETLREALPQALVVNGKIGPHALLCRGVGDARLLPGAEEGAWVVQEEGSQVLAHAIADGAQPGERVLDACAGRGNKSLAILDLAPGVVLDAADLHPGKLQRLKLEADRLGHTHTLAGIFGVDWSAGLGDIEEGVYDRVLIDAPCSGIGTLRRRPEILLRRTKEDVDRLSILQKSILTNALRTAKSGGRVVYATCSVLCEEMEDVLASVDPAVAELLSVQRLLPERDGTDGYAYAVLRKL
jgi:16S rRNA (cytosine967-C5)-methyltransferase